eukprot:SAG31_NODE_15768_length_739_cov_2.181250_1_plen_236_part_10
MSPILKIGGIGQATLGSRRFDELGDGQFSYDPLCVTFDKFDLFAGWLLGDAERGEPGASRDKDLNGFRSALNRWFEEREIGRPLLGVEVERTIKDYYSLQILSKQMRGEDAGLERVPVPETLFVHLLHVARHSTDRSLLRWIATFFLQLLGWLRGNSIGGLQPGDVRFDLYGNLQMSIRVMKARPAFKTSPGLITVPPAPAGQPYHPRREMLSVLRRVMQHDPNFFLVVSETAPLG